MKTVVNRGTRFLSAAILLIAFLGFGASAATNNGTEISAAVMGGYDPVAYFELHKPVRGSGFHTATYNGGTYLFANKKHKEKFQTNPSKYAPKFGGYCAYGVALGKKFYSDPTIWKIVNGNLYLNLDEKIQSKWNEDIPGYIAKADGLWKEIEHKHPSAL